MGKPFFMTEKETEAFLVQETRQLPMPDGTTRPFTAMKVWWDAYDFLVATRSWSEKELVNLIAINADETRTAFEESFQAVLSYIDRNARKKMGID
jgi:hypothetical protein